MEPVNGPMGRNSAHGLPRRAGGELTQRRRRDRIRGAAPNKLPRGDRVRRSSSIPRRSGPQPRSLGKEKERAKPEGKRRQQDLGSDTGPPVLELVARPDVTMIIASQRH